jgi:hypothetical protein
LNEKAQAMRRRLPVVPTGDAPGDETATVRLQPEPAAPPAARKFPVLLVTLLIVIVAAAAGIFLFRQPSPPAVVKQPEPVTSLPVQPQPAPEPEPPVAATPSPADAIANAIKSGDWRDAAARVKQFDKSNPGDPRIKDWQDQIGRGSKHDRNVASLHSSIDDAIASGNWGKADSQIQKLVKEAPDDPTVSKLRRQVEDGARVKALRAAVKSDMKAKRWSDADRDLASLLSLVPGDSEALRQKNDLAKTRQ